MGILKIWILGFLIILNANASVLRIGVPMSPESLFFPIANDDVSDLISQLVVEPLLKLDQKTNLASPVLAKSWKQEPRKITVYLNPSAKFAEGNTVTSQDVLETFTAFRKKLIPSPTFEAQFGDISEIKIQNPSTFEIHYAQPSSDHLNRLSNFYILSKAALTQIAKYKNFALNLTGSGPYQIDKVSPGKEIRLLKRENYWNNREALNINLYRIEKIHLVILPDGSSQIEMLKRGDIDYLNILSSKSWNKDLEGELFATKKISKLEFPSKQNYQVVGIVWNLRLPLFQSRNVREALAKLYPVKRYIKDFFYNSYLPSTGIFHSRSECHSPKNPGVEFSVSDAEKLLKQDGWVRAGDGLLYKNKIPFKFNLIVRQAASLRHLALYQEILKQAGIQMNFLTLDWVSALNKVRAYDFEASEYSMDRPTNLSDLSYLWASEGRLNYSGLSDKKVDDLILKIKTEFNQKKRVELCQSLDERIANLYPLAFGWDQAFLRLAYWNRFDVSQEPVFAYSTWRNAFHHWAEKKPLP